MGAPLALFAVTEAGVHLRVRRRDDRHQGQVQDGGHRRLQEDAGQSQKPEAPPCLYFLLEWEEVDAFFVCLLFICYKCYILCGERTVVVYC